MADLKKLLIAVPVLLVSCFCGCNKSDDKEDIVFTAAEPLHKLGANTSVEQIACISNYACDDDYDAYEDFIDYYYNDFKPSYDCSFYILNPGDGLKGFIPHIMTRNYYIYKTSDSPENFMLVEELKFHVDCLTNIVYPEAILGKGRTNLFLSYECNKVPADLSGNDYVLEFGDNNTNGRCNTYVNIYLQNVCIATCYYEEVETYDKLPRGWFEQFFKENIIKG